MLKKWENGWRKPVEARQLFPTFLPNDFFPPFFKFCVDFFPTFLTTFWHFKTTYFYLCIFCYAVQSLSRQYKTLSPFLGGGCVKAIPRTALLLSKSPILHKNVFVITELHSRSQWISQTIHNYNVVRKIVCVTSDCCFDQKIFLWKIWESTLLQ